MADEIKREPPRSVRGEILCCLLATARREWWVVLIGALVSGYGFWLHGYFAGLGWAVTTIAYVFAMWFAAEASDALKQTLRLLDALQERNEREEETP
jgi:hypothetical protein